jgi:hypothetical protein
MRETSKGRRKGQAARSFSYPNADLTNRRTDGLMDDPPRVETAGGPADADEAQLHPEVAEFVRWFTTWWLQRGLEIVQRDASERRAA